MINRRFYYDSNFEESIKTEGIFKKPLNDKTIANCAETERPILGGIT